MIYDEENSASAARQAYFRKRAVENAVESAAAQAAREAYYRQRAERNAAEDAENHAKRQAYFRAHNRRVPRLDIKLPYITIDPDTREVSLFVTDFLHSEKTPIRFPSRDLAARYLEGRFGSVWREFHEIVHEDRREGDLE